MGSPRTTDLRHTREGASGRPIRLRQSDRPAPTRRKRQRMHPVTVHTARLHKASLRSPAAHSDRTPGPRNSQPNAEPFATPHIPGSYRLRRHFPRYCDVTTRVGHPYQPRILPTDIRPVRGIHPEDTACRTTGSHPPDDRTSSCKERDTALRHPVLRSYYQLAFVTPGIRPFEAISRNWIRLMPNRRM